MKQREGDTRAVSVPNAQKETLRALVKGNVAPGSVVSTDKFVSYGLLTPDGYRHGSVKHGAHEVAANARSTAAQFCGTDSISSWAINS